jgi:putative membrane protein
MRQLIIIGLAASALGGCAETSGGAMTSPTGLSASQADMAAAPAAEFVRSAGASDLYEIQSSQLVLQTTQDPAIRRFAQMMIEHHTQTTASVAAAARAAGMTPPPPALDNRKQAMLQQLQQAAGPDRDALYLRQQILAHEEALALHTAYARSGDAPQLKAAAASARPIVARHLDELRGLGPQTA